MKTWFKKGVTLLELIVVVLIISILSTIAVGVYTREVLKAKIAKTRAEIRTMEIAVSRYQIDTGSFPPSSSGTALAPGGLDQTAPVSGAGYMVTCVRASLNGNAGQALSNRWMGPYMEFDQNRLGTITGGPVTTGLAKPAMQFLDPFGSPYYFVQSDEYDTFGATFLPAGDPYFSTETYFNASTFQIISFGPDGVSDLTGNALGTEGDDITNWQSTGM